MSSPNQLCPNNDWCRYQAIDNLSIYLQLSILASLLVAGTLILKYFRLLIRSSRQDPTHRLTTGSYKRVYTLMLVWLGSSVSKTCVNVYAYYGYMSARGPVKEPTSGAPVVVLSAIFQALDNLSAFLIISLLILIPYEWIQGAKSYITEDDLQLRKSTELQSRNFLSLCARVLNIVRVYSLARYILLGWYFVQAALMVSFEFACSYDTIGIYYMMGESVLILGFYFFGLYFGKWTARNKLLRMRKEDHHKLMVEYWLLVLVLLSRIVLNVTFHTLAQYLLDEQIQPNCYDANPENNWKRSLFLGVGQVCMHLLPIGLVLSIYRPTKLAMGEQVFKYESDGDSIRTNCEESEAYRRL